MSIFQKRMLSVLLMILISVTLASCQSDAPSVTDISDTTLSDTEATSAIVTDAAPVLPDGLLLAGPSLDTVCAVTYPASNSQLQAAAEALAGKNRVTVRAAVPMIAPAHGYTTDTPELKALMDRARAMQEAGKIVDFSIFQAQPWMDIPHFASTVIVTADDEKTARSAADELAHGLWEIRKVLQGTPLYTVEEVIKKALANIGAEKVLCQEGYNYRIDTTRINCDYHKFLKTGKPQFCGEYMSQYSWAEETLSRLLEIT